MAVESIVFERQVVERVEVNVASLGEGLHAFAAYKTVTDTLGEETRKRTRIQQGIVDDENLAVLRERGVDARDLRHYNPLGKGVCLPLYPWFASSVAREAIRTGGHPVDNASIGRELIQSGELLLGDRNDKDFVQCVESGATPEDLLFYDHGGGALLDRHGRPVPMAMIFTHRKGGLDSVRYDVHAALEVLKARDDVEILTNRDGDGPIFETTSDFDAPVFSLKVRWTPTAESWQPVAELVVEKLRQSRMLRGAKPNVVDILEETDALGLAACRVVEAPSAYAGLE